MFIAIPTIHTASMTNKMEEENRLLAASQKDERDSDDLKSKLAELQASNEALNKQLISMQTENKKNVISQIAALKGNMSETEKTILMSQDMNILNALLSEQKESKVNAPVVLKPLIGSPVKATGTISQDEINKMKETWRQAI